MSGETEDERLVDALRRMSGALRNQADYQDDAAQYRVWAGVASVAADRLTAPTPAPEVCEEWGVRDMDGDIWWNREPGRAETEQFVGDDEALVHRTITTYTDGSFLTTPWVEVES